MMDGIPVFQRINEEGSELHINLGSLSTIERGRERQRLTSSSNLSSSNVHASRKINFPLDPKLDLRSTSSKIRKEVCETTKRSFDEQFLLEKVYQLFRDFTQET